MKVSTQRRRVLLEKLRASQLDFFTFSQHERPLSCLVNTCIQSRSPRFSLTKMILKLLSFNPYTYQVVFL